MLLRAAKEVVERHVQKALAASVSGGVCHPALPPAIDKQVVHVVPVGHGNRPGGASASRCPPSPGSASSPPDRLPRCARVDAAAPGSCADRRRADLPDPVHEAPGQVVGSSGGAPAGLGERERHLGVVGDAPGGQPPRLHLPRTRASSGGGGPNQAASPSRSRWPPDDAAPQAVKQNLVHKAWCCSCSQIGLRSPCQPTRHKRMKGRRCSTARRLASPGGHRRCNKMIPQAQ